MSDPRAHEPTRRLDPVDAAGHPPARPAGADPIAYTEEYGGDRERTVVAPPGGLTSTTARPTASSTEEETDVLSGRRFSTPTLVFTGILSLLVGVILALSLLPDEAPTTALDEAPAQQALADATAQSAELQTAADALAAENAQLRADVAARDAEIARLQAEGASGEAATTQAQDERQAAQDSRQAALDEREAALASREVALAEQEAAASNGSTVGEGEAGEAAGTGDQSTLPDLQLPADLPQIDEEAARGVIERLIERLQDLFGGS